RKGRADFRRRREVDQIQRFPVRIGIFLQNPTAYNCAAIRKHNLVDVALDRFDLFFLRRDLSWRRRRWRSLRAVGFRRFGSGGRERGFRRVLFLGGGRRRRGVEEKRRRG